MCLGWGCFALKVAGIILAAGVSRRLGRSKQMIVLGGETLLERSFRLAVSAGLDPVYVVVSRGQDVEFGVDRLGGCTTVVNEAAEEGMASSIRVGVGAAANADVEGVVVMTCDQPAVTVEHLRQLAQGGVEVVASKYAGRRGVPAYFPTKVFEELGVLRGDLGARKLLQGALWVELPGGELDIDTVEELQQAQVLYG